MHPIAPPRAAGSDGSHASRAPRSSATWSSVVPSTRPINFFISSSLRLAHLVPRLGAVVAVVGDHVVAPLGDAGHGLLRTVVEPRAVMEEHHHRERAVAVGPYGMDTHRATRRGDRLLSTSASRNSSPWRARPQTGPAVRRTSSRAGHRPRRGHACRSTCAENRHRWLPAGAMRQSNRHRRPPARPALRLGADTRLLTMTNVGRPLGRHEANRRSLDPGDDRPWRLTCWSRGVAMSSCAVVHADRNGHVPDDRRGGFDPRLGSAARR